MRKLTAPLGALAAVMMVTSAWPTELPTYDIKAYCELAARRDNSLNSAAKIAFAALCEHTVEPRFADIANYKWGYVPEKIRDACIGFAQASYEKLNSCLDKALDVYPNTSLPQIWILDGSYPLRKYWTIDECSSARKQSGGVCRLGFKD